MKKSPLAIPLVGLALVLFATASLAKETPPTAATLLASVMANHDLTQSRNDLVARARNLAARGVITRAHSLAELQDSRIRPSGSAARIENPVLRERFSLATFDSNAASALSLELPVISAAAVISNDKALLDHLRAQLEEVSTWHPLQRPGWSLAANPRALPPEGDGVWLATGWGVRALADTLDLLPPDALSPALRAKLDTLLQAEMTRVAADWRASVPWYVQRQLANSNQWVVPAEALVRAGLRIGRGPGDTDYELGIAALLQSLDAQGEAGEFTEGLTYVGITLRGLVSAAQAAARAGDDRLARHPFLRHTGLWFVHHAQPGGFLVNAFDTLNGARGQLPVFGNIFALLAAGLEDPHALWLLRERDLPGDSLEHLLARARPVSAASVPPLFAHYPVGTRVVWRSSWDDSSATGLWLRGGGRRDFHDHADRGHVNFIIGGRALLIEAGTPPYGTPDAESLYTGLAGHNVLQIGPTEPDLAPRSRRAVAPVTVHRLDADGGSVSIDASAAYPEASRWVRHVDWDLVHVRVRDEVDLPAPAEITFRWHIGAPQDAPRHVDNRSVLVGDVRLDYSAGQPLRVTVASAPDATLRAKTLGSHPCVRMRTNGPVSSLRLETTVRLDTPTVSIQK